MPAATATSPGALGALPGDTPWGRSAIPIRRAADFTGLRLGRALVGFLTFLIVVTSLAPFRFAALPQVPTLVVLDPATLALSFALFVPLGYVLQLTRPRGAPVGWGQLLTVGVGLSLSIEATQLWLPGRTPALTEALANLLGTLAGGWGYHALFRRVRATDAVKQLALELPLVAVLYLLVPLVALGGLGIAGQGASRGWLLLPLVAAGGAILGGVQAGYMTAHPARRQRPFRLGGAAWLALGLVPVLPTQPLVAVAAIPVFFAAEGWWHRVITRRVEGPGADLRFEAPTLRVVLPLFLVYLVAASLWPLAGWQERWTAGVALFPAGSTSLAPALFRAIERVAAFTLAGYLVAEMAGRRADTLRAVAPAVLGVVGTLVVLTEGARGFLAGTGASAGLAGLLLVAALFGARLYQLQRDHVRALIRRSTG